MSFKFKGRIDILSLNTRKEKHGDQRVLAMDIGVEAEYVPAEVIAQLLDTPVAAFKKIWWDSKGKPNLPNMGVLPITTQYKGTNPNSDSKHALTFESFDVLVERASIIDKFKVVPVEGAKCLLTFRIAVSRPDHELICMLADALQDSLMLTITPDDVKGKNEVLPIAQAELPLAQSDENPDGEGDTEPEVINAAGIEEEVSPALAAARESWSQEDEANQKKIEEEEERRAEAEQAAQDEQDEIDAALDAEKIGEGNK